MANQQLTEQEILNDILLQEKHMSAAYTTYVNEASCPNLRSLLTQNLTDIFNEQYQVFDTMRQKGMYQTKDAPTNEVQQAKQQFQQIRQQM
jgi:spore coat protein F